MAYKPPTTLSKKSAAYFKKFVDDYEIDEAAIEVLIRVCESIDRADEAGRLKSSRLPDNQRQIWVR